MTSQHDPISYGNLVLAFIKKNLVFVISFFDHFQFLVFFVSIYIILLRDLFINFPFLHFYFFSFFLFFLLSIMKLISI